MSNRSPKPKLRSDDSLERLDFTDLRHPEVVADRGRRPHVPSSKPTMSKSRRASIPLNRGNRGYRSLRDADGPGQEAVSRRWIAIYERLFRPSMAFFRELSEASGPALDRQPKRSPRRPPGPRLMPPASLRARRRRFARGRPPEGAAPLPDRDRRRSARLQGPKGSVFKEFPTPWRMAAASDRRLSGKAAAAFQPGRSKNRGSCLSRA